MKENSVDTSLIQSKQIIDMVTVANEFCLFVEDSERYDKVYIVDYLQRVLPLLYLKGSMLPEIDESTDTDNERYVIEETWEYIYNTFMNLFGEENSYYFWNPALNEASPSALSENMADLYQDLKDFVFLFAKPSYYAKLNAVYMCRLFFAERWGKCIPFLLSHLHTLKYDNSKINEDGDY